MDSEDNPYQSPPESDEEKMELQPFHRWSDRWMVVLFFVPSLTLICIVVGLNLFGRSGYQLGLRIGFYQFFALFAILGACVSIFSAYVNKCRQNNGWAGMILMIVVYGIAQIFALFLTVVVILVCLQLI